MAATIADVPAVVADQEDADGYLRLSCVPAGIRCLACFYLAEEDQARRYDQTEQRTDGTAESSAILLTRSKRVVPSWFRRYRYGDGTNEQTTRKRYRPSRRYT